ncbi:hypothetical protein TDB9533_02684 [Thalassocella blandensis]|nr:hypothetical protein TDB9533_02684 [Thalassocella blandensis]
MRSIYLATVLLIIGFILGWMSRSYDIDRALREALEDDVLSVEANSRKQESSEPLHYGDQKNADERSNAGQNKESTDNPFISQSTPANADSSGNDISQASDEALTKEQDAVSLFKSYLQQKAFEQAVDLYRELDLAGETTVAELRALIITKLNGYLEVNDGDAFTELANSFLSVYYNDIDVLLLLADFNQRMNYFIEALNVYQMANEYAYSSINSQKVREATNLFLGKVDTFYSNQQSWYMLRQIYERAELVGMLTPEQRIRLAQLYAVTGDTYSAQSTLQDMISRGQAVTKARSMLQSMDEGSPQTSPVSYDGNVALKQYGNQFAAMLALPDQYNQVNLLLDTGASLTTLSSMAFNQLSDHSQYTRLGSRMFHTANGVAMGSVYRFKQVRLGSFVLQDVDIAVLDFSITGDVQGLLGMNILGQFKFHINQKTSQLELSILQ